MQKIMPVLACSKLDVIILFKPPLGLNDTVYSIVSNLTEVVRLLGSFKCVFVVGEVAMVEGQRDNLNNGMSLE
jgi:hypothetical protein